jgi:tetratricopeptide (TPR) repeat protein
LFPSFYLLTRLVLILCSVSSLPLFSSHRERFDEVVRLDPTFAEGHNKAATVLYLNRRFLESITACERVLELEPYHFGAISGMGLNYLALRDARNAIHWFERALAVHPGLDNLKRYIEALQMTLRNDGPNNNNNNNNNNPEPSKD